MSRRSNCRNRERCSKHCCSWNKTWPIRTWPYRLRWILPCILWPRCAKISRPLRKSMRPDSRNCNSLTNLWPLRMKTKLCSFMLRKSYLLRHSKWKRSCWMRSESGKRVWLIVMDQMRRWKKNGNRWKVWWVSWEWSWRYTRGWLRTYRRVKRKMSKARSVRMIWQRLHLRSAWTKTSIISVGTRVPT